MNKIALGTAQFGLRYGINNKEGIPTNSVISNILKYANEKGIDTILWIPSDF